MLVDGVSSARAQSLRLASLPACRALPWFSTVRQKLTDPAYSGFFLKFAPRGPLPNGSYHVPQCDDNYDPPLCTPFYHDQEQTPEVRSRWVVAQMPACVATAAVAYLQCFVTMLTLFACCRAGADPIQP